MGEFTVHGSTDSANLTDEAQPPIRRPAQRSGTSFCRAAQNSARGVSAVGRPAAWPEAFEAKPSNAASCSGPRVLVRLCKPEEILPPRMESCPHLGSDRAPQNGDFHVLSRPRSTVLRAVPGSNCVGTTGCLTVLGWGRGWAWRYLGVEKRKDWKGKCRNGHYTGRGGGCDSNSPTVGHLSPSCAPQSEVALEVSIPPASAQRKGCMKC